MSLVEDSKLIDCHSFYLSFVLILKGISKDVGSNNWSITTSSVEYFTCMYEATV